MDVAKGITREEAREADRRAIEDYGIPSILLMESAGRACAEEVLALREPDDSRPVLVLCGPGNNGGDGFVVARTLWNRGAPVLVVFVGEPEMLERSSDDVRTNVRLWRGLGEPIEHVVTDAEVEVLARELPRASVLVDALFGTGLARELAGRYAAAVRAINEAGRPVLAVDLPSGLDANTGEVLGAAVTADVTVSFVGAKRGFFLAEGPRCCGRIVVAEIGIPRTFLS